MAVSFRGGELLHVLRMAGIDHGYCVALYGVSDLLFRVKATPYSAEAAKR